MYSWLLLVTFATSAEPLEDGTLLFLENCSSVVQRATKSSLGHVGIVMNEGEEAWVYEAIPGRVRRLSVDDYYAELSRINAPKLEEKQIRAFILRPERPFTQAERQAMRHYLDEQIGRRYSVKSYVQGEASRGIHCSELASHTLNESGRYQLEQCHSINPSKLQQLLDPTYRDAAAVSIPACTVEETWCQRSQRRWDHIRTWCAWSCSEAWSFCR